MVGMLRFVLCRDGWGGNAEGDLRDLNQATFCLLLITNWAENFKFKQILF